MQFIALCKSRFLAGRFIKTLMVMKITVFLVLVASMNVSAKVYSQKLTLTEKNAPLDKLFTEIKKQTGYTFVYTESILKKARTVSLQVVDVSLEKVLQICFQNQPFTYEIVEKTIVIKPIADAELLIPVATTDITGIVTDPDGKPISGVSVEVKGIKQGTETDVNGIFKLKGVSASAVLVFSSVGYEKQEIVASNNPVINVSLKLNSSTLGDIVVIGYGSTKRANITSAISSISEKDIKNLPVAGADQMIQGKIPGVTVTTNSGQPGGGVSILVRGITTVNNNQPLYVIDGVPIIASTSSGGMDYLGGVAGQTVQSPLATLNPNDIASIDVLKDASAQAIYGAAGGNGVVLITTKKGKPGEGKLEYDLYYGQQQLQKKLPIMNLRQYAQYYNSVLAEGTTTGVTDTIGEFLNPSVLGSGTDWQDAVFQTGNIQNHQLSFSGGQGKTNYYFSGNYFGQDGILINTGFQRYSLRMSVDQQVKNWLKAGVSGNLSRSDQKLAVTDGQQSVIAAMLYNSPATPVKAFDGSYVNTTPIAGVPFGNAQNPVALAALRNVHSIQSKAYGNLYAEIQFTKDISFRNQLNYDFQLNDNTAFQPNIVNPDGTVILSPSKLRVDKSDSYYYGLQTYLTYNHIFGKHALNFLLGHEASYNHYDDANVSVTGLTLNIQSLSAGTPDPAAPAGGSTYDGASESYFARLLYTYDNRYSVTLSGRRDGSSNFGPDKRIGYFPAVSAGWTISNEKFAQDWKTLSFLKLRLGYGSVGVSSVPANTYTTNIRLASNAVGLFGQSGVPGIPANVGNPSLSWESVVTYNAGLEAGFLNGRIELTIDLYKKITTQMLLATTLPSFAGLDPNPPNNNYDEIEPPYTNAGQMTNTGVDLGITSHNIKTRDFGWNTIIVFSQYKNILDKLNAPGAVLFGKSQAFAPVTLTESLAGQPVGSFYGFVTNGLYRTMTDLTSGPTPMLPVGVQGTWLGDIRYKDLNGDKAITSADQTFIGNPNPKFTYGFTNSFSYKGLDLSIFLTGVYGDQIYNYSRMETESLFNVYENQLSTVLNRYSAANPNGSLPRYNQYNENNLKISDRFIENGSYMRIQNISLGYNLPGKVIGRAKISSFRIYVAGQNLHTFTKYSGYDPELGAFNNNVLTQNIDYGHYPNPRSLTVGANIVF
jgi:TonB-linked SusC/RagA family outer membrane protein